jgi:hypothetical protein
MEQVEQRVQMLLGIFAAHGGPPLELKPAHSVRDLHLADANSDRRRYLCAPAPISCATMKRAVGCIVERDHYKLTTRTRPSA